MASGVSKNNRNKWYLGASQGVCLFLIRIFGITLFKEYGLSPCFVLEECPFPSIFTDVWPVPFMRLYRWPKTRGGLSRHVDRKRSLLIELFCSTNIWKASLKSVFEVLTPDSVFDVIPGLPFFTHALRLFTLFMIWWGMSSYRIRRRKNTFWGHALIT